MVDVICAFHTFIHHKQLSQSGSISLQGVSGQGLVLTRKITELFNDTGLFQGQVQELERNNSSGTVPVLFANPPLPHRRFQQELDRLTTEEDFMCDNTDEFLLEFEDSIMSTLVDLMFDLALEVATFICCKVELGEDLFELARQRKAAAYMLTERIGVSGGLSATVNGPCQHTLVSKTVMNAWRIRKMQDIWICFLQSCCDSLFCSTAHAHHSLHACTPVKYQSHTTCASLMRKNLTTSTKGLRADD